MIKFDYLSVYDPEDVVPGDVLMEKDDKYHYFVVSVDVEAEEYICLTPPLLNYVGDIGKAASRLGFERIDNYKLLRPTKE